MKSLLSGTRGALTAIIAGTIVLFSSAIVLAGTPTLGSDCGAGASIVGSDTAGKVTLGSAASGCTISFSVPYTNAPACTATNETAGQLVAVTSTQSEAAMNGPYPLSAGNVVSYICVEY